MNNKKRSLVYFLFALISFLLAIVAVKVFQLYLTVPLVLLGFSIFGFSRLYVGRKFQLFNFVLVNIAIFLSLIGFLLSITNIVYRFTSNVILSKDIGRISRDDIYESPQENLLGYSYRTNLKQITSIVINESRFGKEQVYNVIYNTDKVGNRLNPFRPIELAKNAFFVGCSFTFGIGLNDDQTLPALFSKLSGWDTFNAGMGGYGPHQALKIIEDNNIYRKRTEGKKIDLIVYRMIFEHIKRAAGDSPWDRSGPCYELSQKGEIDYKGSFTKCKKRIWYQEKFNSILIRLSNITTEMFTAQLARKISSLTNPYLSEQYSKEDILRYIGIVKKMNELSKKRGSKFLVIVEDLKSGGQKTKTLPVCDTDTRMEPIINAFSSEQISYIRTSDILNKNLCLLGKHRIAGDGHPTVESNLAIAKYLTAWLSQNGLN
jgi:hypothetical protein